MSTISVALLQVVVERLTIDETLAWHGGRHSPNRSRVGEDHHVVMQAQIRLAQSVSRYASRDPDTARRRPWHCVRRAIRWALSEVNIWTVLFYTTDHNNMTDSVENKTDGVAETMNPSSLRI
ncbi:hypothetical protein MCOR25_003013 [Pyricularia grisea]|uniref:Uncharacterized protein n=1 Tax=Pyricularia grisea TaxID=148305 RepID=A0A6P8B7W0_PYRGI|nr:hypothetical protein PgNI_05348 [Pyricularia grisea]KAI6375119.1 hypothetical protein MCOR25_003013 [Pyricularia grisea]TLD11333.1 hypothetical protein PgNI_05348 [Pyricularia grisea]